MKPNLSFKLVALFLVPCVAIASIGPVGAAPAPKGWPGRPLQFTSQALAPETITVHPEILQDKPGATVFASLEVQSSPTGPASTASNAAKLIEKLDLSHPLKSSDLDRIQALQTAISGRSNSWSAVAPHNHVWVYRDDAGTLQGYVLATFYGNAGELEEGVVDESHRRSGIALSLTLAAMTYIDQRTSLNTLYVNSRTASAAYVHKIVTEKLPDRLRFRRVPLPNMELLDPEIRVQIEANIERLPGQYVWKRSEAPDESHELVKISKLLALESLPRLDIVLTDLARKVRNSIRSYSNRKFLLSSPYQKAVFHSVTMVDAVYSAFGVVLLAREFVERDPLLARHFMAHHRMDIVLGYIHSIAAFDLNAKQPVLLISLVQRDGATHRGLSGRAQRLIKPWRRFIFRALEKIAEDLGIEILMVGEKFLQELDLIKAKIQNIPGVAAAIQQHHQQPAKFYIEEMRKVLVWPDNIIEGPFWVKRAMAARAA